jgi:hypothetical protein
MAEKESKTQRSADRAYNSAGGGLRVEGPATSYSRTDRGYTIPDTPWLRAWGVGGNAPRPKDVTKSIETRNLNKASSDAGMEDFRQSLRDRKKKPNRKATSKRKSGRS